MQKHVYLALSFLGALACTSSAADDPSRVDVASLEQVTIASTICGSAKACPISNGTTPSAYTVTLATGGVSGTWCDDAGKYKGVAILSATELAEVKSALAQPILASTYDEGSDGLMETLTLKSGGVERSYTPGRYCGGRVQGGLTALGYSSLKRIEELSKAALSRGG